MMQFELKYLSNIYIYIPKNYIININQNFKFIKLALNVKRILL